MRPKLYLDKISSSLNIGGVGGGGGSPLNFDKEKWYCMYVEQFVKIGVFFIFCHNFVTPISNLVIN